MLKGPRFSHLGPFIFLSLVHQLLHQLEFHWSTNLPTNYFREPIYSFSLINPLIKVLTVAGDYFLIPVE